MKDESVIVLAVLGFFGLVAFLAFLKMGTPTSVSAAQPMLLVEKDENGNIVNIQPA